MVDFLIGFASGFTVSALLAAAGRADDRAESATYWFREVERLKRQNSQLRADLGEARFRDETS